MKYDAQLSDLKTQLTPGKRILITLPAQITMDKLASGLSLMLGLKHAGYEVTVVTEANPLVSHSNLYGVGEVKNSLGTGSSSSSGNYVLTLENVVDSNGQIPSLEKLDWYPEGSNLNLVFHVVPGQTFQPTNVVPQAATSNTTSFNLVFALGANNLNELGSIYSQNSAIFSQAPVVNIDNNAQNTNFGKYNVVDPDTSSISEMLTQVFPAIGLTMDQDIASNVIAGIYEATSNLTQNATPETFMVVAQAMQAGAKLPQAAGAETTHPIMAQTPTPQPAPQIQQAEPVQQQPEPQQLQEPQPAPVQQSMPSVPPQAPGFDLSKVFGLQPNTGSNSANETFVSPPVGSSENPVGTNQVSQEEKPSGEYAVSSSPESEGTPAPDWLTPKIFKGGSLG